MLTLLVSNLICSEDLASFLAEFEGPFADYTNRCGAYKFVQRNFGNELRGDKYEFKECYLSFHRNRVSPYQTLCFPEKSYLMFETGVDIKVCVFYTEEKQRNNGLIEAVIV